MNRIILFVLFFLFISTLTFILAQENADQIAQNNQIEVGVDASFVNPNEFQPLINSAVEILEEIVEEDENANQIIPDLFGSFSGFWDKHFPEFIITRGGDISVSKYVIYELIKSSHRHIEELKFKDETKDVSEFMRQLLDESWKQIVPEISVLDTLDEISIGNIVNNIVKKTITTLVPKSHETLGCFLSPEDKDHFPKIYTTEVPKQFVKERDTLAVIAAVHTLEEYRGDLISFQQNILANEILETNNFGIYENDEYIIISFAPSFGEVIDILTVQAKCLIENEDFVPNGPKEFNCGQVHSGFYLKYKLTMKNVVPTWYRLLTEAKSKGVQKKLLFTGGSQGAAVSLLAGLHAKNLLGDSTIVEVVTFAQPQLFHQVPLDLQMPDTYIRYVTSYINTYDLKHNPNYFCVDDVVLVPNALTGFLIQYEHIPSELIHIPCNSVNPDNLEEYPMPGDYFMIYTAYVINWHCHDGNMFLSRLNLFSNLSEK